MKKPLITLAALLAALSLSACNSSNGGNSKESGGETLLKVAFAECGFGKQFLLDWEADYNAKNPDNKIRLELDGDAQMTVNILPRLQNGRNLPDLVMVLATNWQPWAVQGYLEPIDDVYEYQVKEGVTVKDYLLDNLETFGKVRDNYWAIPWSAGPSGIVYNEGMFEQFGWEIPTTVSELMTLCETIKTDTGNAVAPFSWSGSTSGYWDFLTFQWWAQIEGEEGWNEFWKFESPNVYKQEGRYKALAAFQELIDSGNGSPKNSVEGAMGKKFMESQMAFINGEAAMMPNGCWLENEMKSSLPNGFQMKLMKTPVIDGAKETNINYNACGDFMVIPRKAAHKDVAKEFLKYLCTEDACKIFTKASGGLRPFEYKPSEIEGISDFTRECAKMWEEETNVFMTSNNVMYYQNNCNSWPGYGTPYSKMIQEQDTAKEVNDICYNYVSSNWEKFKQAAGTF